ncbi:MAG: response regulator, partial [Methanospirillum sp.]|uniref:response regulator n=1 Tax=Methanospirillum sp. TaxID=45200 RepID=UPI00236B9036
MISVLYVDDEPVLLELGKRFLEKSGKIKVDTFLSADIAIKILSPSRYDAIISDYQMPGMDGLTFLSAVRAIQPDLPFIVYTGQGDEGTAIKALNHGADYYLQKGGNPKIQYS